MYRYLAIAVIVVFTAGLFVFGYPLRPGSAGPAFAERNQGESARCFEIGVLDSYLQCMFWDTPRLASVDLVETVVGRLNEIMFPNGYAFIVGLLMFLILACWMIIMMR